MNWKKTLLGTLVVAVTLAGLGAVASETTPKTDFALYRAQQNLKKINELEGPYGMQNRGIKNINGRPAWFIDEDDTVGLSDLMTVAYHYGESESSPSWSPADVDESGSVGLSDLMTVAYHYGEECSSLLIYETVPIDPQALGTKDPFVGSGDTEYDAVTGAGGTRIMPRDTVYKIRDLTLELWRYSSLASHFATGGTSGWGGFFDSLSYF